MDSYKIVDEFYYSNKALPFEVLLDKNIYFKTGDVAEIDGEIFTLCPVMGAHRHDFMGLLPRMDGKSLIGKTMYVYNPAEKNSTGQ